MLMLFACSDLNYQGAKRFEKCIWLKGGNSCLKPVNKYVKKGKLYTVRGYYAPAVVTGSTTAVLVTSVVV